MTLQDSDTVENVKPALAATKYFVHLPAELSFQFALPATLGCDAKKTRITTSWHRVRTQQLLLTNVDTDQLALPSDSTHAMAVADGMGGAGFGSLASQIAIRTAWELAGRTTSWIMKLDDLDSNELTERIEGFVYMMQQAFVQEFQANPQFGESGTTFTAAYLVSNFAAVMQIGDSPCFLWRDGTMRRVSTDHTIEQEFIAAGVAPEIAGKFSHMLTRCLGYDSHNARPDTHFLRLKAGDQLLLCTDGLTDMVDDTRIAECLDEAPDAQSACERLIAVALDAGGKDNVTAVLARAKGTTAMQ